MSVRRLCITTAIASLLALSACGSSGSESESSTTTTTKPASTSTSRAIGRPTGWRDDTAHWRQLVPGSLALGPAAVADELAARYRGGDTSEVGQVTVAEVRSGEPLVIVLRETGVSDAVPGRDIEITLEGGDQGWAIASARVRDLCMQVDESDPMRCG